MGYVVDVLRKGTIYEIQTRNFAAIKNKLAVLSKEWRVVVVYPIPVTKWILRTDKEGSVMYRRKSPKTGTCFDVFNEVIYLTSVLPDPSITLELSFLEIEEEHCDDGLGSWKRKGVSVINRKLLSVISTTSLSEPEEYRRLLNIPTDIPFTTSDIELSSGVSKRLATRIAYFLRNSGMTVLIGKTGRKNLYQWNSN
jgi:hypothetical protein